VAASEGMQDNETIRQFERDGIALLRGSGKQADPEVSAPANLANWT
jgi:hypothetical protein